MAAKAYYVHYVLLVLVRTCHKKNISRMRLSGNKTFSYYSTIIHATASLIQCSYQFQVKHPFLRRMHKAVDLPFDQNTRKDNIMRKLDAEKIILYLGFFDKIKEAFENDPNDYEAIIGLEESQPKRIQRTEVQKRWMDSSAAGAGGKTKVINAPIPSALLSGTKWSVELYLAGIPDRDPSNNLYGSRINISSRDNQLGLGVTCPEDPSIVVQVEFDRNGVCRYV